MKKMFLFAVGMLCMSVQLAATPRTLPNEVKVADFEDVTAGIDAAWVSGVNQWQSGDFTFTTYKDDSWGDAYYYAFVVSNETGNTSTGFMEPYRSAKGGAYEGDNFAVWYADFYGNNSITFDAQTVAGFFINNNAYAVAAFAEGNQAPARRFTASDKFLLYAIGKKAGEVVDTVTVELAANGKYIADWTYVDLSVLGEIDEVAFAMTSTDKGTYDGKTYYDNTPTYFCLDNFGAEKPEGYEAPELAVIPEEVKVADFEDVTAGIDAAWVSGVNQWQSGSYTFTTYKDDSYGDAYYYAFVVSNETANTSTGFMEPYRSAKGGAYEGDNFAVWYSDWNGNNSITFDTQVVPGFFVNNNAYAVAAFVDGTQAPARRFTAEDKFLLYAIGKKAGEVVDTVTVELAANGKYISEWTYVDLSVLGEIDEVMFAMFTTDVISYDNGVTFYDNTPTYFCLDNFGAKKPEGYVVPEMTDIPGATALDEIDIKTSADKVMMNGRLYIRRNGAMFDLQGRAL